jgi:hypothetical protein
VIILGWWPVLWIMFCGCGDTSAAGLPSVSTVVAPAGPGRVCLSCSGLVRWAVGGGEQAAEGVSVWPVERCRRMMRRDRRAIRTARVINWRRRVPVRARAWNRLAGQPAARVRLRAMAASASQAAFPANDSKAYGPGLSL